ncbi:hypothetical protein BH23PLA1_BH23PLA1_26750 [soil metagenome]
MTQITLKARNYRQARHVGHLGRGGWWHPSREERRSHPELPPEAAVSGRFVELRFEHQGRDVVLLLFTTDLTATDADLAAWYRQHWNIDSNIPDVKISLKMHNITGRSVEMIAKEIALGGWRTI